MVSCAHSVGGKPFIYNPLCPSKKIPVSILATNSDIDLAVLKLKEGADADIESLPYRGFKVSCKHQDTVLLAGYPNYAQGKGLNIHEGKVTGFKQVSGIQRFNISANIIFGNSGGPVLDECEQVIGVAVTGADSAESAAKTDEHGVIPISALSDLEFE